jgi:hypothetical protein
MKFNRSVIWVKKTLLGCAIVLPIMAITILVPWIDSKVQVNTIHSQSSKVARPISSEALNTKYNTDLKNERARNAAVTKAIDNKYDGKVKALQDQLKDYTDKGEAGTVVANDCQYDLMLLQERQTLEKCQENIKCSQNLKRIYDSYHHSTGKS